MCQPHIVQNSKGITSDGVDWLFKATGRKTDGKFDFMVGPVTYLSGPALRFRREQHDSADALLDKGLCGGRSVCPGSSRSGMWDRSADVHLNTAHPVVFEVGREIASRIGVAPTNGVIWHHVAPPVVGLEIEVDVRRYKREIRIEPVNVARTTV